MSESSIGPSTGIDQRDAGGSTGEMSGAAFHGFARSLTPPSSHDDLDDQAYS
jgi:hypothetical protein